MIIAWKGAGIKGAEEERHCASPHNRLLGRRMPITAGAYNNLGSVIRHIIVDL
jgi:hypothetical protein